jgi:hypothetical protein
MRRFDLCNLCELPGRPLVFNPVNDERFSLNGFRLLMLGGLQVAIAELRQRELTLRWIDLFALLF